jgi:preprotein translocase subunit Sec63
MQDFNANEFCKFILVDHINDIKSRLKLLESQSNVEHLQAVIHEIDSDFTNENTSIAIIKTVTLIKAILHNSKYFNPQSPDYFISFCNNTLELAIGAIHSLALCESESIFNLLTNIENEEDNE